MIDAIWIRRRMIQGCAVVGLMTAFASERATASTISYVGNLRTDATVTSCGPSCTLGAGNSDADYAQYAAVVEDFTVTTASTMEAITFSYGGGVNGNGQTIAEGGLEPYLSLFDSAGNFIASTFSSGCPAGGQTNTNSGECYDVELDGGTLAAGSYQIALTAYENMSLAENYGSGTLADGFTGLGNLADGENLDYAFDVDLTPTTGGGGTPPPPPPSPVPEPATGALVTLALGGLQWARSRGLGRR